METVFAPVSQGKNYQAIIGQVKGAIMRGAIRVGDQLPPEREMVEIFNVSRSSVREALKALEVQGIVESQQGGGYFVVNEIPEKIQDTLSLFFMLQGCSLQDLINLRLTLEMGSIRIVIDRCTDEEIRTLGTHIEQYVASGTAEVRQQHDLDFHVGLVKLSRNPLYQYLLNAMYYIFSKNVALSDQVVEDKGMMQETIDIHVALYDAIRNRDYPKAVAELLRHFDFTRDDIDRQNTYFFSADRAESGMA